MITGASQGLGRQLSVDFAHEGAAGISIVARRVEWLNEVRDRIHSVAPDTQVLLIVADLTRHEDIELGAILTQQISSRLFDLTWGTPAAVGERSANLVSMVAAGDFARAAASLPPEAQRVFTQAAKESFISGMNFILLVAAVIAIVGAVLAFALVRTRDMPRHRHPAAPLG